MPAVAGDARSFSVRARGITTPVPVTLWSPRAHDGRLPLLVVHDGPAYAEESSLTRYAAASIAAGRVPAHRVALLAAPERDEWYSASARYARALCADILPALRDAAPVDGPVVGMGASLGALAMLHAQRRHPGCLGALFLQSGSFFDPRLDVQEAGFGRFGRIARFVRGVVRAAHAPEAVPVVLTCGAREENLGNNRLMTRALAGQGYRAFLEEVPGMHDHVAWRNALHPRLTRLLAATWAAR